MYLTIQQQENRIKILLDKLKPVAVILKPE